ncbi:MAG: glucose-1-phosphate adenylyltransferase [Rhodothermaceae bacterium]|nr:glucose-1-phosphate adenylyltransferase [Rhodothermaceae bacterium]
MNSIIAVVLGGGAGTRLFPLTQYRSKPAVPLLGKYRLVDVPISNCLNAGINRMFILTQFNSAGLNHHIMDTYRMGAFNKGFVSVLAAEQTPSSKDWFRGTADAVRQILHHMDRHAYSHVLILSGDQLYQMDFKHLWQHHQDTNADISVATTPVSLSDAPAFGIMQTNEKEQIEVFQEKPSLNELVGLESPVGSELEDQGRVYLASTGIYMFNRDVLHSVLSQDPTATDFGKEIIPGSINKHNVVSYPFDGYWSDVGSIRSYHAANIELTKSNDVLRFYDSSCTIYTQKDSLPPPRIHSSYIQDGIIAEGSYLNHCRVYNTVLGIRSYVGARTTIKNSVYLGSEYYHWEDTAERHPVGGPDFPGIGEACYIENAVIDMNASIRDGVVISNQEGVTEGEGPNYYIKDGIIVIPSNAVVSEGTVIGVSRRIERQTAKIQELAPPMPVSLSL